MKIKPYLEKLTSSKEYKSFKHKYDDAFVAAGFFVLDLEAGKSMHQIDYYVPSAKKIAAFSLDGPVALQLLDPMTGKMPEKLNMDTNIDLDALKGILQDEMKNRNITEDIKKIIAIIQNIDGKRIWNLNCILSGMEILRAHVEDESKTVLKMDRSSIFDYIKKVPGKLREIGAQNAQSIPQSKDDLKKELDKLNKLEESIEKEKQILQKQMSKEPKSKKEVYKKKK